MRVFYRGPGAVITAELVTVVHSVRRSYVLAELEHVHIVRQQGRNGLADHRAMGVSALVSGIIVVPVVGQVSALLAAVVIIVLVLGAVVYMRLGPPAHHELVATYRGRRVVVFASDNEREFDQVCRGFQRAKEQQS
ncbi:DUF6232 family protein [Actinoplanes friuliensis]|uniref:Uncharacterized protein n=1 Tax=Actinoplanes friuliensis DSM 7358 TaxID=1246995 RepID=U5W3A2_9ACTN|nr:DUF6232 family protein [Actinoplanes friuliensis]AGZ43579.1 hypothetical protein AFR_26585 [Actinoplanes friuliensis DSM 7358]